MISKKGILILEAQSNRQMEIIVKQSKIIFVAESKDSSDIEIVKNLANSLISQPERL